jgi:hypothetical protein
MLNYSPDSGLFTWKIEHPKAALGSIAGYKRKDGYIYIQVNGTQYLGHILAWFYMNKEWPSDHIDHINRVRDDNRYCNLRIAGYVINSRNRTTYKNNTSGHKGISFDKKNSNWRAYISVNKRIKHLGSFSTIEAALEARVKAEKEHDYMH